MNREIIMGITGLFKGQKIYSILVGVVIVLLVILVGIIIVDIVLAVNKKKKNTDRTGTAEEGSESLESGQHSAATEDENIAAPAAESESMSNTPKHRTSNGQAHAISFKHVIYELERDGSSSGFMKKILDKITIDDQSVNKFAVIDDVSTDIDEGEIIGIVGTDGSGKSTFLKLAAGLIAPTDGTVSVNKDRIHVLTLDTCSDTEMTGKKYLYKCAEEAGYSKAYVDSNYDRIVKYAELSEFMDDKIDNFSIGMISRLKFALIAADDDPGIVMLDEILSVCDMFYRKKCEGRLRQMAQNGAVVIVVSNVMNFVVRNCTRALWIEKGMLRMSGEPEKVCSAYIHMQYKSK